MKQFLFLLLLIFPASSNAQCGFDNIQACETTLYVDGFSVHSQNRSSFNESQRAKGIKIGIFNYISFVNSYSNPGDLIFLSKNIVGKSWVKLNLAIGIVRGYDVSPFPVLAPYLEFNYKNLELKTAIIPAIGENTVYVAVFFIGIKI